MRVSILCKLLMFFFLLAAFAEQSFCCGCAFRVPGENHLEVTASRMQGATAVFEGIPVRAEVQWSLLTAKEGEVVPARLGGLVNDSPHMVVTFRVMRKFKGDLGSEVQVVTGLGGGDCGAQFDPGLTYLVYAYGPSLRELSVSLCSPGGWIGSWTLESDLRYLRKEQPISQDLLPFKHTPLTEKEALDVDREIRLKAQQQAKSFEDVTGRICGAIIRPNAKSSYGIIAFLPAMGHSFYVSSVANVKKEDGSFCSDRLGPGKYFLYYAYHSDEAQESAVYYPGVGEPSQAIAVGVEANKTQSNISFKVPAQNTQSVRGFISTNDKAGLGPRDVTVVLISMDGGIYPNRYAQKIDFSGPLPLPKTKYFKFDNVLPGHYIAYVSVDGEGWYTKKVDLDVTNHMKFISLELIHKK